MGIGMGIGIGIWIGLGIGIETVIGFYFGDRHVKQNKEEFTRVHRNPK